MPYLEEREFTFRLEARVGFPEEYQGELDGYAWAPELQQIAQRALKQIVDVVRSTPGWEVHPENRGRAPEDEVTLVLTRAV